MLRLTQYKNANSSIVTTNTSTTLTSYIKYITSGGLMTVIFSEDISFPSNYTNFNDSTL
jgi:hypothetical protein